MGLGSAEGAAGQKPGSEQKGPMGIAGQGLDNPERLVGKGKEGAASQGGTGSTEEDEGTCRERGGEIGTEFGTTSPGGELPRWCAPVSFPK